MLGNDELNLRRVAAYDQLRLRDAVARHLQTHPFDKRVTALSYLQMNVFLEMRHPLDQAELEKKALQADVEEGEARDLYEYGEVREQQPNREDDEDFALAMQ